MVRIDNLGKNRVRVSMRCGICDRAFSIIVCRGAVTYLEVADKLFLYSCGFSCEEQEWIAWEDVARLSGSMKVRGEIVARYRERRRLRRAA